MKNLKLILGIIIGFIILLGCVIFVDGSIAKFIPTQPFGGMAEFAIRILLMTISYFVIKKMYKKNIGPSTKNLAKGVFIYGAAMWIPIILDFIFRYKTPLVSLTAALLTLIGIFFSEMGTGVLEELVFRGYFFNAFVDRLGNSKKGVFASMILSSSVFGLIHILNLIGHPELIVATIAQVIYAIMFGCFFCMIYYCSGNIWPCILLHGIIDFAAKFWDAFNPAPRVDDTIFMGIFSVAVCAILMISAIIQLNKEYKNTALENKEAVSNSEETLYALDNPAKC